MHMKTAIAVGVGFNFNRSFKRWALASLALLSSSLWVTADAPPALTTFRWTGTDFEGRPNYKIEWDASPNTLYRLQKRTGFESNTTWETFDIVVPANSNGVYQIAPDKMEAGAEQVRREFFRVLMPTAEIFSVEPALISSNGGTVYLFGQCLGSNLTVRVGGLVMAPNTLQAGSVYSFFLAPGALSEGTYDVEVLDGTNILAQGYKLFSVTGQPTPVGEFTQRLLEPPSEPPASPMVMLMPALMKAKEKANRTKCGNNLRILPATGELQFEEEDLVVPGRGLDFVWTRTYRSRSGRNSVMGGNWSHGYDISCVPASGGMEVRDGTGRGDIYFPGTNGVYTRDEFFNIGTLSNGVFTLQFPDTGKWIFHSLSNAVAPGAIARIEDRHGNAMTFSYDASGRMTEVIDTLNRTNRISYDPSGRVSSVADFLGRRVTYTYWRAGQTGGGDGDLRAVTSPVVNGTPNGNDFPLGKTTTYTYSQGFADERLNRNLLTITDAKGQLWLQCVYHSTTDPLDINFDRLSIVTRGSDMPSLYTYARQTPAASNRWSVVRTIQNDPVGNVTMDWYDSLNRCVIHRDLAARAVPGLPVTGNNLPTTKLRSSDPDYWQTTYEWNLDSLCTRVIHPQGNSTEIVHQRAQDHNSSRSNKTASRTADGNPRVVRQRACCADLDGDGVLELVTRYDYDPRFSAGAEVASILVPEANRVAIKTKGTGADKNRVMPPLNKISDLDGCFVTRCVDPRGNVSVASFDAQGSCLSMENFGAGQGSDDNPRFDFEYNSFGQMTAMVHAGDANGYRRRDQITYYSGGAQNGYMHTFTVDATGPTARTTTYDYDASGTVKEIIDPRGGSTKFHNNALNQLVRRTDGGVVCNPCDPYLTDYFYDETDNVVRIETDNVDGSGAVNPSNPTWTRMFVYDVLDRCTEVLHEWGHGADPKVPLFTTNRYVYDGNDRVIRHFSPEAANGNQPGNFVSFEYDTRGLLHRQWSANGSPESTTNSFDYNENGLVVRALDRAGNADNNLHIEHYEYDGMDRCVRVIDAMGNTATYSYDANGNVLSMRADGELVDVAGGTDNRRLSETHYEYDALDRCVRTRVSFFDVLTGVPLLDGEAISSSSYAPNGACRSSTDARGHTTRYSYDTSGRLSAVNDPKTNSVTYAYDANDNIVTMTRGDTPDVQPVRQTFVTHYEYDILDRCVADYDNVGNTNRYFYDSRGNVTRHTDPRGHDVCYTYDGLMRCTGDISYVGPCDAGITISTSHVEYDSNSRVTSRTDANGNITRFAYDAMNRCVATTNADSTVTRLIWSPRSNVASSIDANGSRVVYTYDDLDRCVRKDITPAATVSSSITFEEFAYDGLSRCVMASNDVSRIEFAFDSMGNRGGFTQDGWQMLSAYDKNHNRTTMIYPGGRVVSSTYDAIDHASVVTTSPGGGVPAVNVMTLGYDGPGRLARLARGNGVNTRITWNGLVQPANAPGDFGSAQVSLINHQVVGGGATVDRRAAAYDRSQNKTLRQQMVPFPTGVPALTTNVMGYDALSRLSSFERRRASSIATKTFAMDSNGNRQSVASNGVVALYTMDATQPQPADFQMDQYTVTPFGTQEYDLNGNLVFIPGPVGGTQFIYDYADRLVSVERAVGPAMVPIVSFTYDALGRRISKTRFLEAPALPVTTHYYLDPDDDCDGVLEESENGSTRKTLVFPHALEVSGRAYLFAGHTYYVHTDELGSALALTDETGAVVERYDYDEFGTPRFLTPEGTPMVNPDGTPTTTSPNGNDRLFRGLWWDGEVGLYFDGGDYIDPKTGQCLSRSAPATLWADCGRSSRSSGGGLRTAFENNPWSASSKRGPGGNCSRLFTSRAGSVQGDPVHGVDVKLGMTARAQGDPIHGVDVKLGVRSWGSGGSGGRIAMAKAKEDVYVWKVKSSTREAGSGIATGRRQYQPLLIRKRIDKSTPLLMKALCESSLALEQGVMTAREAGSGMATGRRQYQPLLIRKRIDKATPLLMKALCESSVMSGDGMTTRESGSGLATGRRQYQPLLIRKRIDKSTPLLMKGLSGDATTGVISPRDAASGLPTGKRQHSPVRFHHRGHVTVLK